MSDVKQMKQELKEEFLKNHPEVAPDTVIASTFVDISAEVVALAFKKYLAKN
ncbi:MAG: hypothetical protein LBQ71_12620 [Hungatella sp.]|jgi:hypothetical protein|nr:hypothetical protein [Hungatella sp.]